MNFMLNLAYEKSTLTGESSGVLLNSLNGGGDLYVAALS
jgi:hypothetical protein